MTEEKSVTTYTLENLEELEDQAPGAVHLPPPLQRMTLQPGDRARIVVINRTGIEHLWVEVVDRLDTKGYVGRVRSAPVLTDLRLNDEIAFSPCNVEAIRTY
jgi:hypothetical protein